MPYWKCPKCDSEETYQGTELVTNVTGSGGGMSGGIIGHSLSEDLDFTPIVGATNPIDIKSTTEEKTVTKCKKCDTLLSRTKDRHKTAKELEAERQEERKKREQERKREQRENKEQEEFWKNREEHWLRELTISLIILSVGLLAYLNWESWWRYTSLVFGIFCPLSFVLFISIPTYFANPNVLVRNDKEIAAKLWHQNLNTFQIENLVKCGMATAQLVSENKVMIIGGSSEEKEAARQWVQENHPEYEIT